MAVCLDDPGFPEPANDGPARPPTGALTLLIDDEELGYDPKPKSRPPRAAWRQVVLSRARRLRHELLAARAKTFLRSDGCWGQQAAEQILRAKRAALQRVMPWSWFEGWAEEQAWLSLHEAEAEIIELLPKERLPAYARDVLHKAGPALGEDDARARCVKEFLDEGAKNAEGLRLPLAYLARAVSDARDDKFAQSRECRNRLIRLTSLALLGVVLGLVAGAMGRLDFNADGSSMPRGSETVVLVALFGAVGALVTAIPPLAKADGKRNPFNLPLFQLLVKLAMGPLFALVGVLVLQDKVISGLQPATDLRNLVIWATIFGAAQQTVTRFIDQRVGGLLHEAPGSPSPKASRAVRAEG